MERLTQHSKTTMFTDSDVMVEGQRLGPAAFEGLSYYRHYVKIINRLAELEDRFCNEPQTRADRIRAMTDEELAEFINDTEYGFNDRPGMCDVCAQHRIQNCYQCWLDWLRQEEK